MVKECKTQDDFKQLFKTLKQRGLEAVLSGELTEHLGYDKLARATERKYNSHNGFSKKTIQVSAGELEIAIPRDCTGTFEPQLIPKYQARIDSIDEKIISLLDLCYPIIYLDCIVVKVRADKGIINKAVYLALGVNSAALYCT